MKVLAVVLATTDSRRPGSNKLLVPYDESTVIEHVLSTLIRSSVSKIHVVLGSDAHAVTPLLRGTRIDWSVNPHPEQGIATSAQCGITDAEGTYDAYLFALGDQPTVPPEVVDALIAVASQSTKSIFVPVHDGRRGHPVLLRSTLKPEILGLGHGADVNTLLADMPDAVQEVPVPWPGILDNLSSRSDYQRASGHT